MNLRCKGDKERTPLRMHHMSQSIEVNEMKYRFIKETTEEIRQQSIFVIPDTDVVIAADNAMMACYMGNGTFGHVAFAPSNPRLGLHSILIKDVNEFELDSNYEIGIGFSYLGKRGLAWIGAYINNATPDEWRLGYVACGASVITRMGTLDAAANQHDKVLVLLEVFRTKITGSLHESEVSFMLSVYINGDLVDGQIMTFANQAPANLEFMAPGIVMFSSDGLGGDCLFRIANMDVGYNNRQLETY